MLGLWLPTRTLEDRLRASALETEAQVEFASRLGFIDVLLTDDLATLERLREHVAVGLWYCAATAAPALPEAPMLRAISAIITPFVSLIPEMESRWPSYKGRIFLGPWLPPVASGPWPALVGGRHLGVDTPHRSVFTGAGLPTPADLEPLLARGLPVVGPDRGVLRDVVALLGGALTPDRLGSARELDDLRDAVARTAGSPTSVSPALAEVVEAFVERVPRAPPGPLPLPPSPPGRRQVRVPVGLRRGAVRAAFEAHGEVLAFEEGEAEDLYEVDLRSPLPDGLEDRPFARPTVAACLILGDPRPTLAEALGSVVGAVDEVCAVFTRAEDPRLAAICAAVGLRCTTARLSSWSGDFAAARNESLSLAQSDYALIIDDDERLVGPEALRGVVARRVPYAVSLTVVNLLEDGRTEPQSLIRLVALGKGGRFEGMLHETFEPTGPVAFVQRPYLVHYGYADRGERERKYRERNLPMVEAHRHTDDRRLASVRLRDLVAAVEDTGQGRDALADAVLDFDRRVVAAGAWSEYLAWSASFVRALQLLERGYLWSPELPVPNQSRAVPLKLGFLDLADLRRFVAWWLDKAVARAPAVRSKHGDTP